MDDSVKKCRAFVALDLPPPIKRRLLTRIIPLQKDQSLEALRWIPKANWHLTLAFLGDQTESSLLDLWDRLVVALRSQPSVLAAVESLSGFPDAKSPVLAAIVEPSESLQSLQNSVREVCEACGIPLDRRRFKPHITLARSRKRQPVRYQGPTLNLAVQWHAVTLYTSELTPSGSLYTPLRHLELDKA